MVKKEDVEAFKNELKNLNYYRKKIKEIDEKIKVLEYEMEAVKGVDYSKQHGSANPAAIEHKKLAMSDEMEWYEESKSKWTKKIKDIILVLDNLERSDRDVVERICVDGVRYRELCDEFGIKSTSSLANAVNNAIAQALKKAGR